MKANLEFNLPEEQSDYIFAVHGRDFWDALFEIAQLIRNKMKYEDVSEETGQVLKSIQSTIFDTPGYNEVD